MRSARFLLLTSLLWIAAPAGENKLPLEETSNELVDLSATALTTPEQIHQELGGDLGTGFIVVKVTLRPVSDKPVVISHDDFLLVDDNQGQRSRPFEPTQIAGSSSLIVTSKGARNGGLRGQSGGPIWGGLGGAGSRLPGGGGTAGNGTTDSSTAEAKVESASETHPNPILLALKTKVLPETSISEPVSGLLYFLLEGKVKSKDLRLSYKTPAGKLTLRFR